MELETLVGEHILTGVDQGESPIKVWGEHFEDCQTISFTLDGKTYMAVENPEDGYRSSMNEIKETEEPTKNNFPEQKVIIRMQPDYPYEHNSVLEIINAESGKFILAIGTGNTHDYYPYFVCEFYPENLSVNDNIVK